MPYHNYVIINVQANVNVPLTYVHIPKSRYKINENKHKKYIKFIKHGMP